MRAETPGSRDVIADSLAHYATEVSLDLDVAALLGVKRVLLDSLAVAAAAQSHRAAEIAHRYAGRYPGGACVVWGTGQRTNPEVAALANGVLLRCNDFNDLSIGARNWGHPSDLIAAVVAAAEMVDASGAQLMSAVALGYEISLALFDHVPATAAGWDYSNLTMLAAVCAVARLMKLDATQTGEALSIAIVSHHASDEIESGDLDRDGDLTLWKRFNAGDAMRQAVYACLLAQDGAQGAVRPFTGRYGFFTRLGLDERAVSTLLRALEPATPLRRVATTTMKRWPVGSRAQSAIQSALAVRAQIGDPSRIAHVRVLTDEAVYHHLVAIREKAWSPHSRETADHSLPYIIASALLDGNVSPGSFDVERVTEPARQALLAKVQVSPKLHAQSFDEAHLADLGYLSRVEVDTTDGALHVGEEAPFPGHPARPLANADLENKLTEYTGEERRAEVAALLDAVWNLEAYGARSFTGLVQAALLPQREKI
jgi:2-methylcitrate dehydratase